MRWITKLRLRLRSLAQGRRVEQELDEELRDHLQRQTDLFVDAGMTPEVAHAAALREMGGLEQRKEQCRDARGVALVESLGRDLRYALRMLRRNPGFALLGVLVMALGIGANTAVFSVVYAVLLKPLPYHDPDRIVTLTSSRSQSPGSASNALTDQGPGSLNKQVSIPDFQDWHDQSSTFEAMAYYATRRTSVMAGSAAEYARVTSVTPEFFRVFAVTPAVGGGFAAEDARPGGLGGPSGPGGAVGAIVSAAWARDRFGDTGAAGGVVGRTLRLFNRTVPIVGVLPAGFDFPDRTDIWFPLGVRSDATRRSANNYLAIGRLKPDVRLAQAQAEMATIGARLAQQYPQNNAGRSVAVTRLQDELVGHLQSMLYLLLGAVGLVLLIACANMATLLLAKATARTQEIAIRAALGASRARIVRQLLIEGLVQALIAGVAGLAVAVWGTRALVALAPGDLPRLADAGVDGYVLAFTLAICVLVSVLFALPPALHASRVDVQDPLRGGATRTVVGGRAGRLRESLVIAEIALTVVLLAGGGLLIKSLLALQHVSMGFHPEHVLVMDATLPAVGQDGRYANPFFSGLLADVSALPGVVAAGATMAPPGHVDSNGGYWIDHLDTRSARQTVISIMAPGTLAALGVPLTRGRDFRAGEARQAPPVAIINEALAREAFSGQDPIGRTIYCLFDSSAPHTIVGVAGDVRQYGPAKAPVPECVLSSLQHPFNNATLSVIVRTTVDPASLADTMRRKARARAADVSVKFTTMEALLDEHVAAPRFRALLLGLFGAIALCLALAGVYGIMAFIVGQRASEMGLRIALGATPGDVLRLLLGRGLRLAAIGLGIGLLCAIAATRLLTGLLFEVTPNDAMTYVVAIALLGSVSMLAIYIPARRSAHIDPLVALRQM
jgi:putative ABC transport system permease protein